jgi:sigma-E factor negative regulatory protein RseC
MGEQIGIVVNNESNGMARVVTDRNSACGGCHSGPGQCHGCLTASSKLESEVSNPVNAGVGDVVRISIPPATLFKGAAIMYLLPIATLILGAVGGLWLGGTAGWGNGASVLGGLAGLGLGFGTAVCIGRSRRLRIRMTPTITAIVTPSDRSTIPLHGSCCG